MEQRAAEIEKKRLAILQPPAPTTKTGTSQSQDKEGQRIRNKKDGKIYVIKDGTPVPEDQPDQSQFQMTPQPSQ